MIALRFSNGLRLALQVLLFTAVMLASLVIPARRILQFEFPPTPPHRYLLDIAQLNPYTPRDRYTVLFTCEAARITLTDLTVEQAGYVPKDWKNCQFAVLSHSPENGRPILTPTPVRPDSAQDWIPIKGVVYDWRQPRELKRMNSGSGNEWNRQKYQLFHPRVLLLLPDDLRGIYYADDLTSVVESAIRQHLRPNHTAQLELFIYPNGRYLTGSLYLDGKPFTPARRKKARK